MGMNIIALLLYLLFAPLVGGLLAGADRIVTARMQGRVGPPILQPFYDVLKLYQKEQITVNKVQDFYVFCFLLFVIITGGFFFAGGDLLLAIFVLTLASAFLIVAGYCAGSPYAEIGAERELLQVMSYEPMVLMTAVGFYMFTGSFRVEDIIQTQTMPFIYLIGVFIGFTGILTIKFRKSPFDLSMSHHAHQELVQGLQTEFSGKTLAMVEIAHWYENVFLLGLVFLFFVNGTAWSVVLGVAVALLTYFIEVFIDNNYARMKWEVTLKVGWFIAITVGFVNLLVLNFM